LLTGNQFARLDSILLVLVKTHDLTSNSLLLVVGVSYKTSDCSKFR